MKKEKHQHPNHSDEIARLRKVSGQIIGIEKMIAEQRYCPDILQQIRAARAALMAVELGITKKHISACVRTSARADSPKAFEKKLTELMRLIKG